MHFSIRRDFRYIRWGATLWYNLLRATFAGLVLTAALAFGGGHVPPEQLASLPLVAPAAWFTVMLPLTLVTSALAAIGVPFVGWLSLLLSLFIVAADPFVWVLHKVWRRAVPLESPDFVNFAPVVFVLDQVARARAAPPR